MTSVDDRRDEEALRRLVRDGVLTAAQAHAVLAETRAGAAGAGGRGAWWAEALGYVGGGLLLAGAGTLVSVSWDDLTRTGKVVLLAAVLLALVGAGVVVGQGWAGLRRLAGGACPARRRVVGVLFALASGVAALAVGVAVDNRPDVAAPAAGLLAAAAGYAVLRTVPGLLACLVFSLMTVGVGMSALTEAPLAMAFGFVALGVLWAGLALLGAVVPRWLGLGVGAGVALVGAQQPIGTPDVTAWAYVLTLAAAAACLVLYRWERTLVLLAAGVLGVTIAVPEVVWDVTDGAGGAALVLLIAGAVLLVASGLGLRLRRGGPGPAVAVSARPATGGMDATTGGMDAKPVNLTEALASFEDVYSPRIVVRTNDYDVRIAHTKGEHVWHVHQDTDEFFLVLDGRFDIALRDAEGNERTVVLGKGDTFVVPRGTGHKPSSPGGSILMFEPSGTSTTADRHEGEIPDHVDSTTGHEST